MEPSIAGALLQSTIDEATARRREGAALDGRLFRPSVPRFPHAVVHIPQDSRRVQ